MAKCWIASELLDSTRAFQPACIILAAADLDIFTPLSDRPMRATALAEAVQERFASR